MCVDVDVMLVEMEFADRVLLRLKEAQQQVFKVFFKIG